MGVPETAVWEREAQHNAAAPLGKRPRKDEHRDFSRTNPPTRETKVGQSQRGKAPPNPTEKKLLTHHQIARKEKRASRGRRPLTVITDNPLPSANDGRGYPAAAVSSRTKCRARHHTEFDAFFILLIRFVVKSNCRLYESANNTNSAIKTNKCLADDKKWKCTDNSLPTYKTINTNIIPVKLRNQFEFCTSIPADVGSPLLQST